ncbi:MAG: type II toxin-antitoxin system VapC family toxin [Pleurocapsa sp.]
MRYWLDTCAWIFILSGNDRLTENQKKAIFDSDNTIYLSVISVWEITIKVSKGKLKLPKPLDNLVFESCIKDGYKILDLNIFNVLNARNLPEHHQDPFDRMIISQAIDNDLIIITTDLIFSQYDVKLI